MSIENLLQNFANATGIIIDRTFNPPRILGQAFLVSKSRMVTAAGCVFNHVETPWALAIKFPHSDVVMGVKTVALHPDFDRKEARTIYLNQTASSKFSYPVQFNDLATMVVHPELKDPEPELVGQLHRALSLPFSSEGVTESGVLGDKDLVAIVKKILDAKQSGLITIFDELNIPIAYLQVMPGVIERVYFDGIAGEMAFAELIYRKPGSGYSFRANESFAWGELRKIEIPATNLIAESAKRAQELPGMLSSLGGPQARYQKVVKEFNSQSFNLAVQWLVNNLWLAIDGYITIDQLSSRVGADTYTITQGLRELSNQGVVSLINRQTPFHLNGQLGTPIVSHTDFDINPGDTLKAFYLDSLTGAPCWQEGDFAGVASVLQPKNLLHSIPIHLKMPGALILKNYKLIGVHSGAVQVKPGQVSAERQLYQMMWIGALFDMGTKKLRAGLDTGEGADTEVSPAAPGAKLVNLRGRDTGDQKPLVTDKVQAYICPSCYTSNARPGNCFNCGALIEATVAPPKREGFFTTTLRIQAISDLQEKYKVSDKQVFGIAGAFAVAFILLIFMITTGNSVSTAPPTVSASSSENKNIEQAIKLAVGVVGFKGIAPPGYWFADTTSETSPLPSFAMLSDANNQKILFVIFNDMSPVLALDRFTQIPPFSDIVATKDQDIDKNKIKEGSQILGEGTFHYFVRDYPTASNTIKTMLVGSFPAKEAGKSVLVLGQTLKAGIYDYKSTSFLIDTMAESRTASANAKLMNSVSPEKAETKSSTDEATNKAPADNGAATAPAKETENKFASEEEINKFCEDMQSKLQKKIDTENDLQEQVKRRKDSKLKVILEIDIDADGNLQKLEIAEPDTRQKTNDDLVKIVSSFAPYADVPKMENEPLGLRMVFKNGNLKIEKRD